MDLFFTHDGSESFKFRIFLNKASTEVSFNIKVTIFFVCLVDLDFWSFTFLEIFENQ